MSTMMFTCGPLNLPPDIPDAGEGGCCMGAAGSGPRSCTCWTPEYDLDQASVPAIPLRIDAAPEPCDDCAYRPDSPERQGDDRYNGDQALLDELVADGTPFWCHQGIRRIVRLRHPSGATYEYPPGAYAPPVPGCVPYRADGQAALLCAGWTARRGVLLRREAAHGPLLRRRLWSAYLAARCLHDAHEPHPVGAQECGTTTTCDPLLARVLDLIDGMLPTEDAAALLADTPAGWSWPVPTHAAGDDVAEAVCEAFREHAHATLYGAAKSRTYYPQDPTRQEAARG